MADFGPRNIVHADLADGLPDLRAHEDGRPLYVIFWWRDVALAHAELAGDQLSGAGLAHTVAHLIAPAVGDQLFTTGFEGVDPTLPPLPRESPPELTALLSLADPLSQLDGGGADGTQAATATASVVVCTRERPDQLRRCLDSIASAAAGPAEVIVVDNGAPTFSAEAVVRDFPGVIYVRQDRPGLSVARNTGVERAAGDVIVFTDDDTRVHPNWLPPLLAGFADPRVMAVTGLVLPGELETEAQVIFQSAFGGFNHGYRRMRYGRAFYETTKSLGTPVWKIGAGANMAVRRDAFEHVGGFDERLGAGAAGCSEDSEFWYRLIAAGWECRYQPSSIVFHFHRRDRMNLERQAHEYIRGHVVALFVQFSHSHDWGNLHRALLSLPRTFVRRGLAELAKRTLTRAGVADYVLTGTYRAELLGYLRALTLAPLALRTPRPRHKAPRGAFLRANPFPYPLTEGFFYREKMRAIHRIAPDRVVRDVLEVGGGRSGLASLLYPAARVTNVDADPTHADSPVNVRPNVRFVCADATALPFPDGSFDVVTMFDLLEHVEADDAAAAEALRVLRPGGIVLVSSPNEHWRFPYHRVLRPICPSEEEMFREWGHVRRGYSLADLRRLFGNDPDATATFITPLTSICHDIGFSRLPSRVRRLACAALAPLTWAAYALHTGQGPGTETAARWTKGSE